MNSPGPDIVKCVPYSYAKHEDEASMRKDIVSAIHALLNSDGGQLELLFSGPVKEKVGVSKSTKVLKEEAKGVFMRKVEQNLISTAKLHITSFNITWERVPRFDGIIIDVKRADTMITTSYNLYLPTETQVNKVEDSETVDRILNRRGVENRIQFNSHSNKFVKKNNCHLHEGKSVQWKFLKAEPQRRTRLADRMIGKGNKFSCYISAFANYQGGHIYFGIDDDGVVEGELIPNEAEKIKIIQEVEKAINKTIWPEQIGEPKRWVHWDIFFEPVRDEDSEPVPSTFVIVIYIAPCLGGVFTEEPQCYEVLEGVVTKMSFAKWKKRILFPSTPRRNITALTEIQVICSEINETLTQRVNNDKDIVTVSKSLTEEKYPGMIEVELMILSKKVMVSYRGCSFVKARVFLNEYDCLLKMTSESAIFEAIRAYLEVALHRARKRGVPRETLDNALDKAGKIAPGLITAAIYSLAATVTSLVTPKFEREVRRSRSPDALGTLALEHLQYAQESPIIRADIEQKAHIALALFYLGCNMSNEVLTKQAVDSKSLEKAKASIKAVSTSIHEGNPMSRYRELQFDLVQSILFYRYSQIQPEREQPLLQEAHRLSEKAEWLAKEHHFKEMLQWARACVGLCTEYLVRTDLSHSSRTSSSLTLCE